MLKNLLSSQGGFASVLLPIAFSSIIFGFGLLFQHNNLQQAREIAFQIDKTSFQSELNKIRLTLGSRHICGVNFSGESFASTNASIEKSEIFLANPDNPIEKGAVILSKTHDYNGMQINKIRFTRANLVVTGSRSYHGTLEIAGIKNGRSLNEILPAYVTMDDSGQILDCSLTQTDENNRTNEDRVCAALNASPAFVYDPSNASGCVHAGQLAGS